MSPPEKGSGELTVLGDSFTLYNDRKPKITFDVNDNGGDAKLAGSTKTALKKKTEILPFDTQHYEAIDYTIQEGNPTWNTKFLNWNTEPDGSGDPYIQDNRISFYRHSDYDDVSLFAQWIPIVCKITDFNDYLLYVDGDPAIYEKLEDAFAVFNSSKRFTMDQAGKKLGIARKIKMLVPEYDLTVPLTLTRGKTLILTTASPLDGDNYPARSGVTVCTIKRSFDVNDAAKYNSPMITDRFSLTLVDITLDGDRASQPEAVTNGGLILVDGDYATLKFAYFAVASQYLKYYLSTVSRSVKVYSLPQTSSVTGALPVALTSVTQSFSASTWIS